MDENKKLCLNSGEIIDCLAGLIRVIGIRDTAEVSAASDLQTTVPVMLHVLCKVYGAHEIV